MNLKKIEFKSSLFITSVVLTISLIANIAFAVQMADGKLYNLSHEQMMEKIAKKVLPRGGYDTGLRVGDSIQKLIEAGVIDKEKFIGLYERRGGLTESQLAILDGEDSQIIFTEEDTPFLLNILWALGLANKTEFNNDSMLNDEEYRYNLAATGGWTLGEQDNGGYYFNEVEALSLTPEQDELVVGVATNVFRPCCNNHTFFQDCNHGSAMLGLLEIGASQGMSEDELYEMAKNVNAFWFPGQYTLTAFYFDQVEDVAWADVDARTVVSFDYSSASGWQENVYARLQRGSLLPAAQGGGGGSCGV